MKKEDFEGPTWQPSSMEIGAEKVKIDEFTFDKMRVSNSPYMLLMLLIAIDPTEKQKEILEKFEVVFTDDNKKQVFPKIDVEKELVKVSGKEEAKNIDERILKDYSPPFLEDTKDDK